MVSGGCLLCIFRSIVRISSAWIRICWDLKRQHHWFIKKVKLKWHVTNAICGELRQIRHYFSISEEIRETAEQIRENHGRVTVLISNAGIVNGNYLLDSEPLRFENLLRINLFASYYVCIGTTLPFYAVDHF